MSSFAIVSKSSRTLRRLFGCQMACLMSATVASAAIIPTGATLYSYPFSSATISNSGSVGSPLVNVVNGQDNRNSGGGGAGRIQDNIASSGFMQYTLGSSTTVGTVITAQAVPNGFTSTMPYTVSLGGQTIVSGPGTVNTHAITVTTLGAPLSANVLRIDFPSMPTAGGVTRYADFQEVLVLPDRLSRIPATATASTTAFGTQSGIYDLDGALNASGGWAGNQQSNPSVVLNFGSMQTVAALLIADWENLGGINATILNDQNATVASVVTTGATGSFGNFGVIKFDVPVVTSTLTLQFTDSSGHFSGVRELIAFSLVPEPSGFFLMFIGMAVTCCARRKQSK